jgi:hypothetical protein
VTDNGMADLISRAAARDVINTWGRQKSEKIRMGLLHRDLDAIPAVDAVPVIRCKDCIYWKSNTLTYFWKPCDVVSTDGDWWYCPCGNRG